MMVDMVECAICKKTGFKVSDTVAGFIDGRSVLVCRGCAGISLGKQEPMMYVKKPRDDHDG